jgi:prephenate dehydrogenase
VTAAADGDFSDFSATDGFRAIGIVGLGLIGGSLALAIRERWPRTIIVGVDRADVLADAVARGVVSRGVPRAAALLDPALVGRAVAGGRGRDVTAAPDSARVSDLDLIVLAAPVLQNIDCLRELADAATRPILVTDVGSTKHAIVTAAGETASPHVTFIGGHPIAGAAHGGLAHARADLFRGRPWIFTPAPSGEHAGDETSGQQPQQHPQQRQPPPHSQQQSLAMLRAFVHALGAEPALLDAAEHDRVMAYVSHLPQLAASGLMRVAGEGVGLPGLALSGTGLADTTRLASSPASVWTEILQSNADQVRLALDAFIADLQAVRDQLASPTASAWLDAGARWRARLGNGARID